MAKHPLQKKYDLLLPAQRAAAAEKIGVSGEGLRQMVRAYRTGGVPRLSPHFAQRVEQVLGVPREKTCQDCAGCTVLKAARKAGVA